MKRWQKLLFLFLAYGLTLMHTVVPHQHGASSSAASRLEQVQAQEKRSVVGFLQFLFAADLGDNHLEIFKKGQLPLQEPGFLGIMLFALAGLLLSLAQLHRSGLALPSPSQQLPSLLQVQACTPLRAPPYRA